MAKWSRVLVSDNRYQKCGGLQLFGREGITLGTQDRRIARAPSFRMMKKTGVRLEMKVVNCYGILCTVMPYSE